MEGGRERIWEGRGKGGGAMQREALWVLYIRKRPVDVGIDDPPF